MKRYLIMGLIIFVGIIAGLFIKGGITGTVILEETQVKDQFEFKAPQEVSRETARQALLQAEEDLGEIKDFGLSTLFIRDNLLKAKRAFIGKDLKAFKEEVNKSENEKTKTQLQGLAQLGAETPEYELEPRNYTEVLRLAQLISFKKKQAYELKDRISIVGETVEKNKKQGLDMSIAKGLVDEAQASFSQERYDETEAYLSEAELDMDKASTEQTRIKGIINLGKSFFVRFGPYLLIIIVIMALIGPGAIKRGRVILSKRKLVRLKRESETLNKLIIKTQEQYFKERSISESMFKIKSEKYRKRLNEIKHTIPVLEAILDGKKKKEPEKYGLEIKKEP